MCIVVGLEFSLDDIRRPDKVLNKFDLSSAPIANCHVATSQFFIEISVYLDLYFYELESSHLIQ